MVFITELTGYEKTEISDLQGSWGNLRNAVIDNFGFTDSDKLMFYINEAMSWESVRDLKLMKATFILVQNVAVQANAPKEVIEWVGDVRESLDEAFAAIAEGKAK